MLAVPVQPAAGVRVALLVSVLAVFSAPLVFLVLGSLAVPGLPPPEGDVRLVPRNVRWDNYETAAAIVPLARQLLNSLLVVAVAVPVTVLVASTAGFAIVVAGPRVRRALLVVTFVAAFVPAAALWVPRVALLRGLGLAGETVVVALPALVATSPLFVLLFALAVHGIPPALLDAARSEGLGAARTWWSVVLPQVRGTVVAVGGLAFVAYWSNVVEPLLLLTREADQTAALGIRTLGALEPTFYPIFLAGAVLVTLPAVTVFVLAQRFLFDTAVGRRGVVRG